MNPAYGGGIRVRFFLFLGAVLAAFLRKPGIDPRYDSAEVMQVFLERDEPRVLPIPYWTDDGPQRRYWNLKGDLSVADRITELKGSTDLREFVLRLNEPGSRFATLGCDQWTKVADDGNALTHEAGLYVDIVFDRFETAAKRRNYLDFFARLRSRGASLAEPGHPSGLTIVRLQPQRVDFTELRRKTVWMMSTWIFGAGPSEAIAIACRRRGLDEVSATCHELGADLSDAGTPIPPR